MAKHKSRDKKMVKKRKMKDKSRKSSSIKKRRKS
jgi:hypothetical protein